MIDRAVQGLVEELVRRGQTMAVAESLTGGLLAATVVTVPGVSRVFRGGLVTYATDLKHRLVGVDAGLLAERGPVDADVAVAMARGARERCVADWGLATTGVAGPGPQDGIAAGTVYVAVSGDIDQVRRLRLSGTRAEVREATVRAALELLATALAGGEPGARQVDFSAGRGVDPALKGYGSEKPSVTTGG